MRPFEAILFDLDGTLVNSRAATEGAWRDWGDAHGLDGEQIALTCHGRPSRDHVAEWAPHLDADAEAAAIERAQVDSRELTPQFPYAGILVESMPPDRVAIVSITSRELTDARIRRASLRPPALIAGSYEEAMALMGRAPSACLAVDDSAPGLAAATAAGAQVVDVGPHPDLEPVLEMVRRHRHVPELVAARARIAAVFADVPRPADEDLRDVDGCDLSVYARWQDIDEAVLIGEWGAPFFLTPEALRWYVPAGLRAALDHPEEGLAVTDALIRAIDRASYTDDERAAVIEALDALGLFVDVGEALARLRT